jgi:hypothetical protein
MDIKELDKKQLILLTLLITFVVSIATGIITVSLMKQMPASVPQTINNVIQRTIEKVTTVETPSKDNNTIVSENNNSTFLGDNEDALVNIYPSSENKIIPTNLETEGVLSESEPTAIGQGVIISEIGLILVDSSILTEGASYEVLLNKTTFNASILKKFNNGFSILKISEKKNIDTKGLVDTKNTTENKTN